MEKDQFVNVQKNGYKGKLHITTWKRIGMEYNKEGWVLIPDEPSEVTEIREKKMSIQSQKPVQEMSYQQENVIVEKSEPVIEENILKVKKRGRPSLKNDNQG